VGHLRAVGWRGYGVVGLCANDCTPSGTGDDSMTRTRDRLRIILSLVGLCAATLSAEPAMSQGNPISAEASEIAEEAFIYGFPMVMNYAVFYEYFVVPRRLEWVEMCSRG
jgi:hypothetical protein